MESKADLIRKKMDEIQKNEDITVLLCVEAGSRAWHVPSVDSDYDVRFVFVHNDKSKYIDFSTQHKDTILVHDDDLDIKGYDIRKAYEFIFHGEANVYEWLASDIVYTENKDLRWLIDDAARENFDVGSVARCYYGMAKRTYMKEMRWVDQVKVKKYLYCLRSILCCQYVLNHNSPVPLNMDSLTSNVPVRYTKELNRLKKLKTETVDNAKTKRSYALEDSVLAEITMLEGMLRGRWAKQEKSPDQMNSLLLKYIQGKV